jgi:hypothetical protein
MEGQLHPENQFFRALSRADAGGPVAAHAAIHRDGGNPGRVLHVAHASFSTPQFIGALLIVPISITLAEAFSPHTWDTPYMFLVGGGTLLAIMKWL